MDCPGCGKRQHGQLLEGLEAGRYFGPRLEATVTNLHHERRIIGSDVERRRRGLNCGARGQSRTKRSGSDWRTGSTKQSHQRDETSARVHGRNWWQWGFIGDHREYHTIVPSRGYDVNETFMRKCEAEVWICDCWKAQLNAPPQPARADRQASEFDLARDMQALFRKAIHLGKRREALTAKGYERQAVIIEKELARLLQRTFSGLGRNLLGRYRKYRAALFIFLHRSDVPAHTAPAVGAGVTMPANAPYVQL